MKLLIDENLPPRLAGLLNDADHDAVHVRDLDAAGASDPQIIDLARTDGRTIVSADTDFEHSSPRQAPPHLPSSSSGRSSIVIHRNLPPS